jgi:hypothetical protein
MYNFIMKRLLVFTVVLFLIVLVVNNFTGFLYPYLPFYNYYGVEPSNDSWKNCPGEIHHMNGKITTSENQQKFEFWTVKAIKEKNPSLCKNVGIFEGSDLMYPNQHKAAVNQCIYIIDNNSSFVDKCDVILAGYSEICKELLFGVY